jgi:hypothetical protein
MKRALGVMVVMAVVVAMSAGVALAWGPGMWSGQMGPGYGPMMGRGMMGGVGGFGGGAGVCPGLAAGTPEVPDAAVTESRARELATEYADKYFPGYKVERVLPFTGRFATMYQVELQGPSGETRVLHINRWGNVMPFGPRWRG